VKQQKKTTEPKTPQVEKVDEPQTGLGKASKGPLLTKKVDRPTPTDLNKVNDESSGDESSGDEDAGDVDQTDTEAYQTGVEDTGDDDERVISTKGKRKKTEKKTVPAKKTKLDKTLVVESKEKEIEMEETESAPTNVGKKNKPTKKRKKNGDTSWILLFYAKDPLESITTLTGDQVHLVINETNTRLKFYVRRSRTSAKENIIYWSEFIKTPFNKDPNSPNSLYQQLILRIKEVEPNEDIGDFQIAKALDILAQLINADEATFKRKSVAQPPKKKSSSTSSQKKDENEIVETKMTEKEVFVDGYKKKAGLILGILKGQPDDIKILQLKKLEKELVKEYLIV